MMTFKKSKTGRYSYAIVAYSPMREIRLPFVIRSLSYKYGSFTLGITAAPPKTAAVTKASLSDIF